MIPALLTVPKEAYNGSISGQYPAIKIRDGDHFQARVNCAHRARSCNVIFSSVLPDRRRQHQEPGTLE